MGVATKSSEGLYAFPVVLVECFSNENNFNFPVALLFLAYFSPYDLYVMGLSNGKLLITDLSCGSSH